MSHDGSAPTGQDAPQDRKALLLEQFNEVETADSAAPAAPVTTTPAPALDALQSGRARDDQGRFAQKDKDAAPPLVAQQTAPTPAPAPQEPWMKAPNSWKKDHWEGWAKIDPAYQRYIHEREQQMKSSYEAAAPRAELADKLSDAAKPYMQTIQGLGMDLPTAVSGLMKVDHDLRTLPYEQKLQVLQTVARGYGIDLSGQAQTATPLYDPGVQNMQNELLAIKGQFANFTKQQEQAQERAALDEIQGFKQTAEHFDEVQPLMVKLLQSGVAEGIKDAYEKAISLTPELFEKIQSAKQAAADADKRKVADEAAKRAKAAAVSVKSTTPGAQKPNNAQDRRSMLREQFDGLSERL